MSAMKGKVALVTGAAGGIGSATAVMFARHGVDLALTDLDADSDQAKDVLRQVEALGVRCVFLSADVSDPLQCDRMVRGAADAFGRLDFAFNNAGISGKFDPDGEPYGTLIEQYPFEMWQKVIAVNLTSVFNCLKAEIDVMEPTGGGAIVNTASVLSIVDVYTSNPAYTAAKHGVAGLTKHVANNYGKRGFRCNAVAPAIIESAMSARSRATPEIMAEQNAANPMGRYGKPDEVAGAVVWLCSAEAGYVNGHLLTIDGGYTIR